jgi:hypothetical protein
MDSLRWIYLLAIMMSPAACSQSFRQTTPVPVATARTPSQTLSSPSVLIFPQQVESERTAYQDALTKGELIVVDGCLRLRTGDPDGPVFLLIWPPGYALRTEGEAIEVLDKTGRVVVRVGERVQLGGGESPTTAALLETILEEPLPEQCPGPYWMVAPSEP